MGLQTRLGNLVRTPRHLHFDPIGPFGKDRVALDANAKDECVKREKSLAAEAQLRPLVGAAGQSDKLKHKTTEVGDKESIAKPSSENTHIETNINSGSCNTRPDDRRSDNPDINNSAPNNLGSDRPDHKESDSESEPNVAGGGSSTAQKTPRKTTTRGTGGRGGRGGRGGGGSGRGEGGGGPGGGDGAQHRRASSNKGPWKAQATDI
ncbi:hypothetical protein LTR64_001980 [Lithohypha guttulata]|uniref:uncharacterized protein n=1 Tax=Lithohypha guttulata TaxID=1690604 RepID=UPI002DDF4FC1|nr:hypothetical protein LTR51_007839 [Lithohypha guttulata]